MHDHTSHPHPVRAPLSLAPSLLRLSVMQRLAIAAVLAAILWGAVAWALLRIAP